MIVLGIDGSLSSSGIALMKDGVIDKLDVIRTAALVRTPTESSRLNQIYIEFSAWLTLHNPDIVIMENSHIGMNKKTGLLLARVRGVYQVLCALNGIPFATLEPGTIKRTATGRGNASKEEVQDAVKELYPQSAIVQEKLKVFIEKGKHKTDDMADAVAIVHTYLMKPDLATLT